MGLTLEQSNIIIHGFTVFVMVEAPCIIGVGPQTMSKHSWTGTFQVTDVSSALLSTLNFFLL